MSVIQLLTPRTIAVSAMDIPYIRPKLLVKENDLVKTGTPLFCDKRNKSIHYVSPGTGTVQQIVFGERRRLKEVIIRLQTPDEFIQFEAIPRNALESTPKSTLIKLLQEGGLWQCFRQFPSKDTADESLAPPLIIVSLNGNDLYSPHPQIVLKDNIQNFEFGLKVLKKFSNRIVVTSRKSSIERLNGLRRHITHTVPDFYPAWDPGAVLYHLKTSQKENRSWTISAEHLILVAKFLLSGKYPVSRIFTVIKSSDKKPHIISRQGVSIKDLVGNINGRHLITTGYFNGRAVEPQSHIGFFETTLNIIRDNQDKEMCAFLQPGFKKTTVSKSFFSCLTRTPKDLDCNLHGEERACINCGYCIKICPVDLTPNFIMKALHSDDIEDALDYGLLDCIRCGLCSYTCPSKIELTKLLSDGMDLYYKDKE